MFHWYVLKHCHFSSGSSLELSNGCSIAFSNGSSLLWFLVCNILPRHTAAQQRLHVRAGFADGQCLSLASHTRLARSGFHMYSCARFHWTQVTIGTRAIPNVELRFPYNRRALLDCSNSVVSCMSLSRLSQTLPVRAFRLCFAVWSAPA